MQDLTPDADVTPDADAMPSRCLLKLSTDAEILRLQRQTSTPSLARFAAMPERNMSIVQAYATGCYSMKEIAQILKSTARR